MIKFARPDALYLLIAWVPLLLVFLYYLWSRKRAIQKFGDWDLVQALMPDKPGFKHTTKFILITLAFISLVIALANPQLGSKLEKVKRSGVDLMVALDISQSMLAQDERPSRLARSRQFISSLIDELKGDRIGLIIFAGNAYLQVPLTSDYVAVKTFLQTITTELAPTQGTAIGEAIKLGEKAFENGDPQFKAMLILSDGENHEPEAQEAAEAAGEKGIIIHTLGVGTPKGAPIPVDRGGREDYKRDNNGSIVFSKLNENMLQRVAVAGNGKYFRLSNGSREVRAVESELSAMERKEYEERVFTDYEDQFQWFLALAIFLLVIEYFLSERKNRWFNNWKMFETRKG